MNAALYNTKNKLYRILQCDNNWYRAESDNGECTDVRVYQGYEELTQDFDIIGVETPSFFLTLVGRLKP